MSSHALENNSSKWTAATVAVAFHLLLFLLLWLNGFHRPITQKEEGIEVMLGSVAESKGSSVQKPITPSSQTEQIATKTAPQKVTQTPPILTQDQDDSYALKEQQRKVKAIEEAKSKVEEQKRFAADQLRQAEEQRRISEINTKTSGAFGRGAKSGSGTSAIGKGFQGSSTGNATTGAVVGIGGRGHTPSYSLKGRTPIGELSRPSYTDQVEGVIVVEIVVSGDGKIVDADIDVPRSTISSRTMRDAALKAAQQSRFNNIDSKENQIGSITYIYRFSK